MLAVPWKPRVSAADSSLANSDCACVRLLGLVMDWVAFMRIEVSKADGHFHQLFSKFRAAFFWPCTPLFTEMEENRTRTNADLRDLRGSESGTLIFADLH